VREAGRDGRRGLQLIAQVFANALARKQTEKAWRESEAHRNRAKEALEQSERKLRLLSSHLLSADETERKRISKELHDQMGQDLVGLKLHVGSIQRELSEGKAAVHGEFESVKGDIDRIIENVRRLSWELGPYALSILASGNPSISYRGIDKALPG
jgi:signal transduction histidine kinase